MNETDREKGKKPKIRGKVEDTGVVQKAEAAMTTKVGEEVSKKLKKGRENTEVGGKEEMADGIPRRRICDLWR